MPDFSLNKFYFSSILVFFIFISCLNKKQNQLPVYSPSNFNPELVDRTLQGKSENHKVSEFHLINQNGDSITQENYKNKIYVADFFFTRCPSICPIMTNHMKILQDVFLNDDDVMFLSLSVTPELDSVPVLREYANDNGVVDAKWNIATGNKKHIYELARKSYFAVVEQGDGGLQDFIHTPNFVLVDRQKQIRGIYDGTNKEEINKLINDIKRLKND